MSATAIDIQAAIAQINNRIDAVIESAANHRQEAKGCHPNSSDFHDASTHWALALGQAVGLAHALFYLGDLEAEKRVTAAAQDAGAM